MRHGTRAAIAIVAGALAVAGCAPTVPVTSTPTTSPAASSSAPVASAPIASTAVPSPSATAGAGAVTVDTALLDVLPEQVQGATLIRDAETAAEIVAQGGLPRDVAALAVGLYVGPGSSTADDLAIVNVVRLRPGASANEWFRSWRETYDKAACDPAGGVAPGSAEAEIGGHLTYIGSCVEGAHTYHVNLADPERLISITSLGEGRFGEGVVAGLTE